MVTDEEIEAKRKAVADLRARVEKARAGGEEKRREIQNATTMANLAAEEARLQAELDQVEHDNKPAVVKASATPLVTAEEQMKAAIEHQKAVAHEIAESSKTSKKTSTTKPTEEES